MSIFTRFWKNKGFEKSLKKAKDLKPGDFIDTGRMRDEVREVRYDGMENIVHVDCVNSNYMLEPNENVKVFDMKKTSGPNEEATALMNGDDNSTAMDDMDKRELTDEGYWRKQINRLQRSIKEKEDILASDIKEYGANDGMVADEKKEIDGLKRMLDEAMKNLEQSMKSMLSKSEIEKIEKEMYKADGNPVAICTASVGRENKDKYEECVMHLKKKFGVKKTDSSDYDMQPQTSYIGDQAEKDFGTGNAGAVPNSLLARQDLEPETSSEKTSKAMTYSVSEIRSMTEEHLADALLEVEHDMETQPAGSANRIMLKKTLQDLLAEYERRQRSKSMSAVSKSIDDFLTKGTWMDDSIYMPAKDVRIGDNVWEHNIVESKELKNGVLVFNGDNVSKWFAKPMDYVWVTNRPKKDKILYESKKSIEDFLKSHDVPIQETLDDVKDHVHELDEKLDQYEDAEGNEKKSQDQKVREQLERLDVLIADAVEGLSEMSIDEKDHQRNVIARLKERRAKLEEEYAKSQAQKSLERKERMIGAAGKYSVLEITHEDHEREYRVIDVDANKTVFTTDDSQAAWKKAKELNSKREKFQGESDDWEIESERMGSSMIYVAVNSKTRKRLRFNTFKQAQEWIRERISKSMKDNIDALIEDYQKTGHVAFRHPKKGTISIDGRTMPEKEAVDKMKSALKEDFGTREKVAKSIDEFLKGDYDDDDMDDVANAYDWLVKYGNPLKMPDEQTVRLIQAGFTRAAASAAVFQYYKLGDKKKPNKSQTQIKTKMQKDGESKKRVTDLRVGDVVVGGAKVINVKEERVTEEDAMGGSTLLYHIKFSDGTSLTMGADETIWLKKDITPVDRPKQELFNVKRTDVIERARDLYEQTNDLELARRTLHQEFGLSASEVDEVLAEVIPEADPDKNSGRKIDPHSEVLESTKAMNPFKEALFGKSRQKEESDFKKFWTASFHKLTSGQIQSLADETLDRIDENNEQWKQEATRYLRSKKISDADVSKVLSVLEDEIEDLNRRQGEK